MKKKEGNRLIFLGTGGGKNVMFTQFRKTGGIFIDLDSTKFIMDPGPGSLINAQQLKLKPEHFDAILLSHLHPDHSTDVNVLLDGMKNATLIAEEHCLIPKDDYYPCVSKYHQEKAETISAKMNQKIKLKNLKIETTDCDHYAPTIGFKIIGSKSIGYASDGTYYKGQESYFEGCDLLILNVLVPKGKKAEPHWHMGVNDAIDMLNRMKKKPKLVVIQHFSFWVLRPGVWKQAKAIQDATKIKCIPAEDFMEIDLDKMKVKKSREK